MILVLNAKTAEPVAILHDGGYLTNLRTAIAGLIVAKYLAPTAISAIGVIGTGVQARLQTTLLKHYTQFRDVVIWGRSSQKVQHYIEEMSTDLVELGEVIQNHSLQRHSSQQITVADLTGVAVQDIQIFKQFII